MAKERNSLSSEDKMEDLQLRLNTMENTVEQIVRRVTDLERTMKAIAMELNQVSSIF